MSDYRKLEWYFADGICIEGDEAYNYLSKKLNDYKATSKRVDSILLKCLKLNVISEDDSIDISVCNTKENLADIRFELEVLIDDLNSIIGYCADDLL